MEVHDFAEAILVEGVVSGRLVRHPSRRLLV